jgi:hypothetical protein
MLAYLRFEWKLRKLYKLQDKNDRDYADAMKRAAHENEKATIHFEAGDEHFMLWDKIEMLVTNELRCTAARLLVEMPESKDETCWEAAPMSHNQRVLTRKGIRLVRQAIREEKGARARHLLTWTSAIVGVIGALVGVVGGLTGLAAVLMK